MGHRVQSFPSPFPFFQLPPRLPLSKHRRAQPPETLGGLFPAFNRRKSKLVRSRCAAASPPSPMIRQPIQGMQGLKMTGALGTTSSMRPSAGLPTQQFRPSQSPQRPQMIPNNQYTASQDSATIISSTTAHQESRIGWPKPPLGMTQSGALQSAALLKTVTLETKEVPNMVVSKRSIQELVNKKGTGI